MERVSQIISGQPLVQLLKFFPEFELSYEIIKNNTPPPPLDTTSHMSLQIPIGPKYFAWFSTSEQGHGVYLLELNRQKKISACHFYKVVGKPVDLSLYYGTILYGTFLSTQDFGVIVESPETVGGCSPHEGLRPSKQLRGTVKQSLGSPEASPWKQFIIEDIYYYKGQPVSICLEKDKWCMIYALLSKKSFVDSKVRFSVPHMNCSVGSNNVHHTQFRSLHQKTAYVNYIVKPVNKLSLVSNSNNMLTVEKSYFKSYKKPQYNEMTIFKMSMDDVGNDLYKLYAYGPNKSDIFYDYVFVQDMQTSHYLKQIFGKTKINYHRKQNLDYMEESDDENDDIGSASKTTLLIKCRFNMRFKKWTPVEKVKDNCRIVHISQL